MKRRAGAITNLCLCLLNLVTLVAPIRAEVNGNNCDLPNPDNREQAYYTYYGQRSGYRRSQDNINEDLKFEDGKTYGYNFRSEVSSTIVGTTAQKNGFKVMGSIDLSAGNKSCDVTITLRNFRISSFQTSSHAAEDHQISELEGSSLRFFWKNRRIFGFCLTPGDPTWASNIKRAVASLFVNAGPAVVSESVNGNRGTDVLETDVTGTNCSTIYTRKDEVYTKTKNFNHCSKPSREHGPFSQFGTSVFVKMYNQKSTTHFNSQQNCTQNFSSGILNSVNCSEIHGLEFFSSGSAGAQAKISTSLELINIQHGVPNNSDTIYIRSEISFDTSADDEYNRKNWNSNRNLRNLLYKIRSILNENGEEVNSTLLGLQSELKHILRFAKESELRDLAQELKNNYDPNSNNPNRPNPDPINPNNHSKTIHFLLDTAIITATGDSLNFVLKFNDYKISDKNVGLFTFYSVFAQNLDANLMLTLTRLVSNSEVNPQLLLAASTLAFRFATENCTNSSSTNPELMMLTNLIAKFVETQSTLLNDPKIEYKTIVALQALGNLKILTPESIATIKKALKVENRRVKINALQALRRHPCQEELRNISGGILADYNQTADIRIHAYLAFMRCETPKNESADADFLSDVLRIETSTQVKTFIRTHTMNTDGERQYRNPYLKFLYKIPPRNLFKYSENFVHNYDASSGNRGQVEGNILYSTDSFFPRSLDAKLNLDFNDKNYEFMQVGLNLDGVDAIFRKEFGMGGKFSLPHPQKNPKRLISESVTNLLHNKQTNQESSTSKQNSNANIIANAYFRLFGSTIYVKSFESTAFFDSVQYMKDLISRTAKLQNSGIYDFNNFILPLKDIVNTWLTPVPTYDATIPTIAGFPLKLSIDGIFFNRVDFKRNQNEFNKTSSRGTSSANVHGILSVKGGPLETGISFDTNFDWARGLNFEWNKGTNATDEKQGTKSFKIGIPVDKDQTAEIRNNIYWVSRFGNSAWEKAKVVEIRKPELEAEWCSKGIRKVTGLDLCTKLKFPYSTKTMPWFPLDGETIVSAKIGKSEPGIQEFYVEVKGMGLNGKFLSENSTQLGTILIDTRGSSKNFMTNLSIELNSEVGHEKNSKQKISMQLNLDSWWKDLKFKAKMYDDSTQKYFEIKISNNGQEHGLKAQKILKQEVRLEKLGINKKRLFAMSSEHKYELSLVSPTGHSNLFNGISSYDFDADDRENEIDGSSSSGDLSFDANIPAIYLVGNMTAKWEHQSNDDYLIFNLKHVKGSTKYLFQNIKLNGFTNISRTFKEASVNLDAKYGQKLENDVTFKGNYDFKNPKENFTLNSLFASATTPCLNFQGFLTGELSYKVTKKPMFLLNLNHKHSGLDLHDNITILGDGSDDEIRVLHIMNAHIPLREDAWNFTTTTEATKDQISQKFYWKAISGEPKNYSHYFQLGPSPTYEITANVELLNQTLNFFSKLGKTNETGWNFKIDSNCQKSNGNQSTYFLDAVLDFPSNAISKPVWDFRANLNTSRMLKPITIESGNHHRDSYIRIQRADEEIFNYYGKISNFSDLHLKSTLRNVYVAGVDINSYDKNNKTRDNLIAEWSWKWLPTGRKLVHSILWEGSYRSNNFSNFTGNFAWDAERNLAKNFSYGFLLTYYQENENSSKVETFSTKFESQGTKVQTKSKHQYRNQRWSCENRVFGFGLDYETPEEKAYYVGIETVGEFNSTVKGKFNFKAQTPGEELQTFSLDVIYEGQNSVGGNSTGWEGKMEYQSGLQDKSGRQYPSFPVNLKYKKQNGSKLLAAWVPTTGDVLFLTSYREREYLFRQYFVKEFWISGMNYSLITHDGRIDGNKTEHYLQIGKSTNLSEFTRFMCRNKGDDDMTTISHTRNEGGITYLLTQAGASISAGLLSTNFKWDNHTIHKFMADLKINTRDIKTGIMKSLDRLWMELTELENSAIIAENNPKTNFNFDEVFEKIKENKTNYVNSRITPEIESSVASIAISVVKEDEYPLVNMNFQAIDAILDGIGRFFTYLSKKSEYNFSSAPISEKLETGYKKLEKFSGIVETYHQIKNFLNPMSNRKSFLARRIRKILYFMDNTYFEGSLLGWKNMDALGDAIKKDLRNLFPYTETSDFLNAFEKYNSDEKDQNETELKTVIKLFANVLEKGWSEVYKVDYNNSVITSKIPLPFFFTYTWHWRYKCIHRPEIALLNSYAHYEKLVSSSADYIFNYSAIAILVGNSFISFDGKVGVLSSPCKYLLVTGSDLDGKNFSIYSKLKRDDYKTRRFYTSDVFLSTENEYFHLERKKYGGVTINGEEPDVEYSNGLQWAVIKSNSVGVRILCSVSYKVDICIVKLNGYYHGRVEGVLGKYNNEPMDDFALPPTKDNVTYPDVWKFDHTCSEAENETEIEATTAVISGAEENGYECESLKQDDYEYMCYSNSTADPEPDFDAYYKTIKNPEKPVCSLSWVVEKFCSGYFKSQYKSYMSNDCFKDGYDF